MVFSKHLILQSTITIRGFTIEGKNVLLVSNEYVTVLTYYALVDEIGELLVESRLLHELAACLCKIQITT